MAVRWLQAVSEYFLLPLCRDGGVECDEATGLRVTILIGAFADIDHAIAYACKEFNCRHLLKGVLKKKIQSKAVTSLSQR